MALIHHVAKGDGGPPVVLVHGFACAHDDWAAQIAHFSARHRTVAVDLRGHGASPGTPDECSIERYGADVAEVMRALDLPPALVVGHSMGCRVAVEAALQAPERTAGLVLLDGSHFVAASEAMQRQRFARGEYRTVAEGMFGQMFLPQSDKALVARITARALALPEPIGRKVLTDMARYDVRRLAGSLALLDVPVLALQTTYTNERRERASMTVGQRTPYLDLIAAHARYAEIQVIAGAGHFPQIERAEETNAAIAGFLAKVKPA